MKSTSVTRSCEINPDIDPWKHVFSEMHGACDVSVLKCEDCKLFQKAFLIVLKDRRCIIECSWYLKQQRQWPSAPIYTSWFSFNFSFMVLFTDIERCQCNEVIWKAVTGVLIFINILLVVVIVWQQKRGNRELFFFTPTLFWRLWNLLGCTFSINVTSTNHFMCHKM